VSARAARGAAGGGAGADGVAFNAPGAVIALWFGVLGPPAIWFARLGISYLVVPYACVHGQTWWLHAVAAVTLAGTAAAGLVAWLQLRRARDGAVPDGGGAIDRTRFLARVGILSAAFFFAVIAAESVLNFLVDPCITGGRRVW
jgi:hypothetical protein